MWMLILPIAAIAAIAFAVALALARATGDKPTRKQPRLAHPDQSGKWEHAGAERRNAR